MMSSDSGDLNDQDAMHAKHLDMPSWSSSLGDSKFGFSGAGKEESIWKQTEIPNVWGVTPVTGNTWGRTDDYSSMFQGIGGGDNNVSKSENLKSFGGWDSAVVGDQMGTKANSFGMQGSSDVWRGFQEYDPFKRSWGEVDFTAVTAGDKAGWGSDNKEIVVDKSPQEVQQQKSATQSVQKSASMSELTATLQPGNDVQPISSSDGSLFTSSLPLKSVSSGNFFPDPIAKPDSERSQPDGAEVSQQNKEEMIAKMVNSHDGWGKKPIRQDTPWQTDGTVTTQAPAGIPDANALMPPGTAIGSEAPKLDLSGVWNVPEQLGGGGNTSTWSTSFLNPSASSFSGPSLDWGPDNDIGLWSGPPPPGCDMNATHLWSGPPKDPASLAQPTLWSSNTSTSGWPSDMGMERNLWANDSGLNYWQGPPKTPDELSGHKKGLLVGGQSGSSFFGGQGVKPIGMWGDSGNMQTETGYWNQSSQANALQALLDSGLKKEDLRQLLANSNLTPEKLISLMNSRGGLMKDPIEPPRGRMLRGKSVIETSTDYNQSFPGSQRGVGGPFSAFQPPQQQLYNQQQQQQQLLLQKTGLVGAIGGGAFQHGRSASHISKMDNISGGLSLNQSLAGSGGGGGGSSKNVNMLQSFLQLQSLLQPLLVERSQLQQNKMISISQKKSKLDTLNQDIAKIKACIEQLQVLCGASTPQSLGSFNQPDTSSYIDEARLRQAFNQMKVDPYSSSTSPLGSFLGLNNSGVSNNDLAALLQNVNISGGTPNPMNNWMPGMMNNMPSGDAGSFFPGHAGHQQDSWGSYLSKSGYGGVPPPPGLLTADKVGSSFMGQQGLFNRSTSWAPGEKSKSGYTGASITNWLLIKNTSSIEGHVLFSLCCQCGSLQQLLSNKLTGHSLACFKDESLTVQAKLQQVANLLSDCLSSQDVFNLLDASGSGGVGSAWVAVTSSASTASTSAAATAASSGGNSGTGGPGISD